MAIITTSVYLEDASRTAGEAMTINSGGSLTIRTDSRVHANAPASMLGSLGAVTINEGSYVWTSATTRWMAFNSGSGNVPAIGTSVTQGGVSGYLLGVWAAVNSGPTAVGAAMPSTGFLKFREVTGGSYSAGALTGIGASAASPDDQGWIEIAHDAASNITVPRIGKHTIRGNKFFLVNTTGVLGQQINTPTNGSTLQIAPGAWVETSPGSAEYEFWPAIYNWNHTDVGDAWGATDRRLNVCKALPGGILQFGELYEQAATYASLPAQASTYSGVASSDTYTWENNVVTVYASAGHGLSTGQTTGVEFTSGDATALDNVFAVFVKSPEYFEFELIGAGTGGNATVRAFIDIAFTAHTVGINDEIHADFTSGSGVDGYYTCSGVASTSSYRIEYPSVTAITSGNVSVLHSLVITVTAHALTVGQRVYLDITSGSGVDGVMIIGVVRDVNSYEVSYPHSAAVSGNCIVKRTIGNIPPANCRVWIPSTILTECATANRAINTVPNTTLASRPKWVTTNAGSIDFEYLYVTSGYMNFSNAYSVKLKNTAVMDYLNISNAATAFDLDNVSNGHCGVYTAFSYCGITLAYLTNGGEFKNSKVSYNYIPSYSGQVVNVNGCSDVKLTDCIVINLKEKRTVNSTVAFSNGRNNECTRCKLVGNGIYISGGDALDINDLDFTGRINGLSVSTSPAITNSGGNNATLDGLTFGFNGEIADNNPSNYIIKYDSAIDFTMKNIDETIKRNWRPNLYAPTYAAYSDGSSSGFRMKRCKFSFLRSSLVTGNASDADVLVENSGIYSLYSNGITPNQIGGKSINVSCKGVATGAFATSTVAAVYGTHFMDIFTGEKFGKLILAMNEPSPETASRFSIISGRARFNASGAVLMYDVGDRAEWEDECFRLGHTGFLNEAPVMSSGTIGNYLLEYKIDTGSGYSAWKTMSGANLSAETVNPAVGFKMKWAIETVTANASTVTYISISTTSSESAQLNLYPLNTSTITILGMAAGSVIRASVASTDEVLYLDEGPSFTIDFTGVLNIEVRCAATAPYYRPWATQIILAGEDVTIISKQELDQEE